ncbi:MAG: acyl-protein synthetase [Lachnospiraceae bacterium]|nr:acyl-protein synthetase [Lachnospiraceae bacterium]
MQENLTKLLEIPPYGLTGEEKRKMLEEDFHELIRFHHSSCEEYGKVLDLLHYDTDKRSSLEDMPMLPVRMFKEYELRSVPRDRITKTMTSSGTSGQKVSRICLDAENSSMQTKVLAHIMSSYLGEKRLPMLILDTPMVRKDRAMFSARGAGIIGFTMFGRKPEYILDEDMNLDRERLKDYISAHKGEKILLFGYTYMIWKFVLNQLQEKNLSLDIEDGILFHVGGWKKLQSESVDTDKFNQTVRDTLGNVQVFNYYGMAEQLGSIFVECEHGHMHCSNFSDILIRRSRDFSVAGYGERGMIELFSLLPSSYPGHILLTEDEGELLGEDDCPCGRKGKYFKIHGRIKQAEVRGCSDTFEKKG